MVDLAIGLGLPLLEMVLRKLVSSFAMNCIDISHHTEYIDQGHRFNIYEDVGCYPFTYNTPVGYALVVVPPVAIGVVSGVYCSTSNHRSS